MINHVSIAVENPERVANFLAEIWDAHVFPFPPAPGSFFVLADDGLGSAFEVTPADTVLVPGEGLPDENDLAADTSAHEAQFVRTGNPAGYTPTHININTRRSIDEIRDLAQLEGWRVFVANRDRGLFQLIEVWVENTLMIEVMTPEQTKRYREVASPAFLATAFGSATAMPPAPVVSSVEMVA